MAPSLIPSFQDDGQEETQEAEQRWTAKLQILSGSNFQFTCFQRKQIEKCTHCGVCSEAQPSLQAWMDMAADFSRVVSRFVECRKPCSWVSFYCSLSGANQMVGRAGFCLWVLWPAYQTTRKWIHIQFSRNATRTTARGRSRISIDSCSKTTTQWANTSRSSNCFRGR